MDWEMEGAGLATYCLILTANILADLRCVPENIGNDGMSVQNKFGLERDKSAVTKQRHAEHTLKTRRSLFRSDFHTAITSLSFLEWTNRMIPRRPLRSATFFCISPTVLQFGAW